MNGSTFNMSNDKRRRVRESAEARPDLQLVCAGDKTVLASYKLLMKTTCSRTMEDKLVKLAKENPMVLHVKEDDATAWTIARNLIQDPLSIMKSGLDWDNIDPVITLACKHELVLVLQACELYILVAESIPDTMRSNPSFLKLLEEAQLQSAYAVMTKGVKELTEGLRDRLSLA